VPALLTGVAIASYTAIDRVGVRLTTPWLYGWFLIVLMGAGMAASLWVAARFGFKRDPAKAIGWQMAAAIGVISWGAYLLVLVALYLAPLAIVAPVRETAIVAVAIWGVWRLRERKSAPIKLAGAAATLLGVVLLAI
jgi:drug/metabolite transporter (DMT)-like permease